LIVGHIKPEASLAHRLARFILSFIWSVALEAILREDGPDVSREGDLAEFLSNQKSSAGQEGACED